MGCAMKLYKHTNRHFVQHSSYFTFKLHNTFYLCDMYVATTKYHDRGYFYDSFSAKYQI